MTQKLKLFENASDTLHFHMGETVFADGEPGAEMYVIRAGKVDIVQKGKVVETLEPGNMFGEMALIDSAPRSATAVANTDCELVAINAKRFEFMVQETPNFALTVMKVMTDRLRRYFPQSQ
jgi:CRP-like cAMP-binding protein